MSLVTFPRQFLVDVNGSPRVGAKAYFYQSGTTTPITTYTTAAYAVANANPVLSVAGGFFPVVYVDPSVNSTYKLVIKDSADVTLYTEDNIPALGFTQTDIAQILYPQTEEEDAAGLTVINFQYEPLDLWRYLSTAQIADVASGTASIDLASIIQDVIDYASSLFLLDDFSLYNPAAVARIRVRPGKYRIGTTLTMDTNNSFCHIIGDDSATFYFVGSGACLHIGNSLSTGVLPAHIKNINFLKDDNASGSIALKIEHAANGCYEEIGVQGFETAIYIKGGINVLIDAKRKSINGSTTALKIESSQGSGGGLRLSNNILTVRNLLIHAGVTNGITIDTGSGVVPIGVGGALLFENVTFEQLNSSGTAVRINNAGEIPLYEEVLFRSCWFEFYGSTLASITNSRVRFEHCFIANASTTCFKLMDDNSHLKLEAVHAYFTDSIPTDGHLVSIGGTATTAVYKNILVERCTFPPLEKLHASYPDSDYQIVIKQAQTYLVQYNANYPAGNTNNNSGLALALFTEASKLAGTSWLYCDVVFLGTDGTSTMGRASLRLYRYTNAYAVKDLDGVGTGYAITNPTASNATITFTDGGTNRWLQMVAAYTVYQL